MDVILGLVAALEANVGVSGLVGSNVFDFEIDPSLDLTMAFKAVVVRPQGGPASPRQLQINDSRVNVMCYGETQHLAYTVYVAIYQALKDLTPSVWKNTYIHWANEASGPIAFRDPQLQWPYNVSSWLVRASDLTVG